MKPFLLLILLLVSGIYAQQQDTTKAWPLEWDPNPASDDVKHYNVYQIQATDTTDTSTYQYTKIAETPHIENAEVITHTIHFLTNTVVNVAWTVTAVDYSMDESDYASNANDASLHRTRFIQALPPAAPSAVLRRPLLDESGRAIAWELTWPRNTETDVHFYNIWQIEKDSINQERGYLLKRVGRMAHSFVDSLSWRIEEIDNEKPVVAFGVSAVDHKANQGGLTMTNFFTVFKVSPVSNLKVSVIHFDGSAAIIIENWRE